MTKNGTIFAATILTGESTQSDCRNHESEIKEETRTGKISEIVQVQPRWSQPEEFAGPKMMKET